MYIYAVFSKHRSLIIIYTCYLSEVYELALAYIYICTLYLQLLITYIIHNSCQPTYIYLLVISFQKSPMRYREMVMYSKFGAELRKNCYNEFKPHAVAVWEDLLVITDNGPGRVLLTDFYGHLLEKCPDIYEPRGLAVDPESELVFVSEYYRHIVRVLRLRDLTFVRAYDGGGKIAVPTGVGYNDGLLYVCCNKEVVVLSTRKPNRGQVVTVLTGLEDITHKPLYVAAKDDLAVVAYPEDRCLVKYPVRNYLPSQQGLAIRGYHTDLKGISFDSDGNLLVARGDRLLIMNESGDILHEFTDGLVKPVHAVTDSQTMVVSDAGETFNKVKIFKVPVQI